MNAGIQALVESLRALVASEPQLDPSLIESLVLPSIRLTTRRIENDRFEIGASRIGGTPDMPRGFDWPRWMPSRERHDKFGEKWLPKTPSPLGFIAQIDLGAMPQIEAALPQSGWLGFFYDRYCEPWGYDPADRGCCHVAYFDCPRSSLQRAELPDDLNREHVADPCAVAATAELTLPEELPGAEYDSPIYKAYRRVDEKFTEANGLTHRLRGHPQLIQNPMELECQLASNGVYCGGATRYQSVEAEALAPGAADWQLLLQIDTDEDGPGWMWGDTGRIYFWIRKQDLAARRFDDVWLIFQCC
jgi:uncharacterized protein YwqG